MSTLTPWQRYQQDIKRSDFAYDPTQEQAVKALQKVFDDLLDVQHQPSKWQKMLTWFGTHQPQQVKGLYLWGGVGRGKTYLMDTFYEALPFEQKLRSHFHHFMHQIHLELKTLEGIQNPLVSIAENMSKRYKIICFDEFFVSDITDAMLLGTLFQELFKRGVVLVATSNIIPDDLYKNGLQRARFLPAIAEIKANCVVLNVDSGVDYRLRALQQAAIYYFPLNAEASKHMEGCFKKLVADDQPQTQSIEIEGRLIPIIQQAKGVLMIDFLALCDGPRSQTDYIEIAHVYHTVMISSLKQMGALLTGDDVARRFLALVDECYERHVKLIISAEVALEDIYTDGQLNFEFKRCRSRLVEMQSEEYLALEHLP